MSLWNKEKTKNQGLNLNYDMYMSHVTPAQNYESREGSSNFRLPTSNYSLTETCDNLFLFKKKETFKNMFSWAVCDRDGRYLTISVKKAN